jgi:hypothetical protein
MHIHADTCRYIRYIHILTYLQILTLKKCKYIAVFFGQYIPISIWKFKYVPIRTAWFTDATGHGSPGSASSAPRRVHAGPVRPAAVSWSSPRCAPHACSAPLRWSSTWRLGLGCSGPGAPTFMWAARPDWTRFTKLCLLRATRPGSWHGPTPAEPRRWPSSPAISVGCSHAPQLGYIENVVKKARDIKEKQSKDTLSNAIKSRKARQDYKEAVDTYNPATHQANIRDKRKEFARIITTKTTSPQAKEDAQKQFKKTNYVFKRKSNAGRPPNQPSKQTAY